MNASVPAQVNIYSAAVAALDIGVVIYEPVEDAKDFRILAMNPAALVLSKVVESEVVGTLLSQSFPGAKEMGFVGALRRVHSSGSKESLPPLKYSEPSGEEPKSREGWFQNDIYPLSNGLLMAVYSDITEDVKTRAEIETQHELLELALPDGIFHWQMPGGHNPVRQTVYFSNACREQLGYSSSELPNDLTAWEALLRPEKRAHITHIMEQFADSDETLWDVEMELRHKLGHYVWIRSRGKLVRDKQTGQALRCYGIHMNVDEDKRRRDIVASQRSAVDALFAALPDLFFLVDTEGRILNYQAPENSALFTAPENFMGKVMSDVLPDEAGHKITQCLQKALRTGALAATEYVLPINGSTDYFDCRIAPAPDGRAAIIVRDVSAEKRAVYDLNERMKELQGLFEIHRRSQTDTEINSYAQHVCEQVVASMQAPEQVRASLYLDGATWHAGKESLDGPSIEIPLETGSKHSGSIEAIFSETVPPLQEELDFLKGAAASVSLWLSNRQALDDALLLERALGSTDSEVALLNEEFRYQVVNPAYALRHGLTPSELTGLTVAQVLGDSYAENQLGEKLKEAQNGARVQFQQWRESPKGARRIDVTYAPYSDERVQRGVAVSIHDVTSLHEAEEQLRRVAEVFTSSAQAVMMTEVDGTIIDVNDAFSEITGFAHDQAVGQTPAILSSERHNPYFFREMFRIVEKKGRWQGEVWNRRANGEVFPCLLTVSPVHDKKERLRGYVGSFNDITNIKENEHYLELLARQDPLTALPNRSHLRQTLDSRLARAAPRGDPITIMFIDLDQFKDINDSLGHSAGDELLKVCSKRLVGALRDDDVIARIGGDEFVALLFDVDSYQNVSVIASKLIKVLEQPILIGGESVQVSASVGICRFPEDGSDTETLLRNADTAMYAAKKAGRATWKCYSHKMTDDATRYLLLSSALREAVKNRDLQVVFQPKYDVESLDLVGFEALSRWHSPDFGTVSPDEFITMAENSALIVDLDYAVLETVCAQVHSWQQASIAVPKIAVNVSGRTLQQAGFFQQVQSILQRNHVDGHNLELELTETALLPQPEKQVSILDQVRALGLTISIDDFGTGYSSLSYLQRLPVSTLKIDASFVREISINDDADAIAEAIIAMARALGMGIVAEGVENELQARFLRERGPMSVQGFLYSKAVNAHTATEMLS
ncbi:EAL domain-containing protein [Congregibacter brevis]|uniref:EAL domain-containing protein n=1 Tax=Congregibacter brevis TaxID=3081201 RepID=A0ABZ0IA09_9GAMM|nr:EAL domain-containing protein [Congregibacter sp. IMCC45268]